MPPFTGERGASPKPRAGRLSFSSTFPRGHWHRAGHSYMDHWEPTELKIKILDSSV